MPKQVLQVTDFSAGLNAYSDAKDIEDNQFAQNWNAVVDKAGVIRVAGMAEDHIITEFHDNSNFQKGYGLFQFSTDYSLSEISSDFNSGIQKGTLTATGSGATAAVLQAGTEAQDTDYYKYMQIFIYSGTGVGESATITGSNNSSPPTLQFASIGATLDGTSKYIIYKWYHIGYGEGGTVSADVITDGVSTSMESGINQVSEGYYSFSKGTANDNESAYLGAMTYNWDGTDSQLSLKAGVKYNLSFRCAGAQKYLNAVSDGKKNGAVTISGQDISANVSDRVPGITLTNASISDSSGAIVDCTNETPGSITDWTNGTYYNISPTTINSDEGRGGLFNIVVGSGAPTFYFSNNRGEKYAVGDTLVFPDPGGGSSSTSATLTVASNGVNKTGLALTAYDTWVNANVDNAIGDTSGLNGSTSQFCSNYVDNGDFAAGVPVASPSTDVAWTLVDSGGFFTGGLSVLNSDGYDGNAGTLKCVIPQDFTFSDGVPDSYFYNELTLDSNIPYNLNFLYDSSEGIQFSVKDTTTGVDDFIIPWQHLPRTRTSSQNPNYRFGGANYNSLYSDNVLNADVNYINFKVGNNPLGQAVNVANNVSTNNIRIQFAPLVPSSEFRLHGVTVFKAVNDLVTMSYSNSSISPYSPSFVSWSSYNASFVIPKEYGDDSNWKLTFNFGSFAFRSGTSLTGDGYDGTGTQKIFIDDVNITSNESDIVTLLSDNTSTQSSIHAYSNKNKSWKTDLFKWQDVGCQPVYTYVNGMLKISDANFSTSNQNILFHFINEKKIGANDVVGWSSSQSVLPTPPSIYQIETSEYELSTDTFNGTDYLNLYFSDQHFGMAPGTGEKFHGTSVGTNWNLDEWGNQNKWKNNRATYHGIVNRIHQDDECPHPAGHGWISSEDEVMWTWYNRDSEFYKKNIQDGHDPEEEFHGTNFSDTVIGDQDTVLSYKGLDAAGTFQSLSNASISYRPNNPIQMVFHGIDNKIYYPGFPEFNVDSEGITGQGMAQIMPVDTTGDVYKFYIEVEQTNFCRTSAAGSSSWPASDNTTGPTWTLQVGKVPDSYSTEEIFDMACKGNIMGITESYTTTTLGTGENRYVNEWAGNHSNSGDNSGSEYDELGRVTHLYSQIHNYGGLDIHLDGWPWRWDIHFHMEVILPRGFLSKNDTLVAQLQQGNYHSESKEFYTTVQGGNQIDNYGINTEGHNDHFINWPYACVNKIPKIDISFYNKLYNTDSSLHSIGGGGKSSQVDFTFGPPEGATSTGWGDRMFKLATTSVNIYKEESYLSICSTPVGADSQTGTSTIVVGNAPSIKVSIGNAQLNDVNIERTNFYMKDTTSDIWFLQFYVNHKTLTLHSTTSSFTSTSSFDSQYGLASWYLTREHLRDFNEVNSYEFESGVSQDDAFSAETLTARYKTAVVANNRLYVGNVKQGKDIHGDRMLKSPVGKYNLLPASNFIDVAINDGDEITALSYYKDKILQFKKRKIFIINISGDYEFLEDTFSNVGVNQQCQVVTTPHGIVWANRRGCHLYDGEKLTNLIDSIIPETTDYTTIAHNYWVASNATICDGIPVVGYVDNRDTVIVKWEADDFGGSSGTISDGCSYHFPTKSWAFLQKSFSGDNLQPSTGAVSNMITGTDGDLLYYRFKSSDSNATSLIKKWNNAGYDNGGLKFFTFTTKDFTFGEVSIRKKIYKVYITYKTNSNSKVIVATSINSANSFSDTFNEDKCKFQGTSTACYDSDTNGLLSTSNVWKTAEMFFTTPANFNNIYSLQLQLYSAAIPSDFEINDISIVYKAKNLK